jgi:hypothetical protein
VGDAQRRLGNVSVSPRRAMERQSGYKAAAQKETDCVLENRWRSGIAEGEMASFK